jgi:hypothetical protein
MVDASWAHDKGAILGRLDHLERDGGNDMEERRNIHRRIDELNETLQHELSGIKVLLAQLDTKLSERSSFLKVALGLIGGGVGGAGIGGAIAKWWNP